MEAYVALRWAFASVELFLGLYMLVMAHFPTYIVLLWCAMPFYLKTTYTPADTYGIWVRIAGGCLMAGFLVMAYAEMFDNFPLLMASNLLHIAGGICIALSFFFNRS